MPGAESWRETRFHVFSISHNLQSPGVFSTLRVSELIWAARKRTRGLCPQPVAHAAVSASGEPSTVQRSHPLYVASHPSNTVATRKRFSRPAPPVAWVQPIATAPFRAATVHRLQRSAADGALEARGTEVGLGEPCSAMAGRRHECEDIATSSDAGMRLSRGHIS